ncbi:MAG TPA: lamin tail domain-containing protein [Kofleriaceae bacterium]|nr:lamin tail domain-containing protein [Kofleriaceae bacterium]
MASTTHVPGQAHGNNAADQAPGASANDLAAAVGLDCDCAPRVCIGSCTGAAAGTACDDNDRCTGDGTCAGDTCEPGAATCVAGTAVDACTVQSGTCDGATGECFTDPLAAGTTCGDNDVCNGAGDCVECISDAQCAAGFVCSGAVCVGVPHVTINEIESSGGVPGDWIELTNTGTAAADVGGWRVLDNDNTHVAYVIPAGTIVPIGGYVVLNEAQFVFGLGAADSARLFDTTNTLVDSYSWTAHAVTTYGRCPDGTGAFKTTTSVTKGAANDCSIAVHINEIESSGGTPGDWVELFNAGPISVDMSGWIFRDNDNTHAYAIPAGTTLAPGAYYLLEEAAFGFGLGAADSARLFESNGNVIDTYTWTAHAATTYGRCPNGSGSFATTASSTKGAANTCGGGGPTGSPWPGRNAVAAIDATGVSGVNVSGLFYDGTTLWAVRNNPSELLTYTAGGALTSTRTLVYPNGSGVPDAEDLTKAELSSPAMYVVTERDNANDTVSRMSILRYDTSASGTTLVATNEWNLTADIPTAGPNVGLEAITWIPDTFLVSHSFFDSSKSHAYNPAEYANHGTGLFFVGVEATGQIYVYALDHATSTFTRIASFSSGDPVNKALYFDRDVGYLWTYCGSSCGNQAGVMTLGASGVFSLIKQIARPSSMANLTNEGIAIAPESQCSGGQKTFWWTDDGAADGHALRADTIPCGAF